MPELIWDGKYDKDGRRTAPLRVALPFQTVETVNETSQQRQLSLDRFLGGRDPEWRNRVIWGDNKYVLPSLLAEFAGTVDLIYIDPPFATGQDFSFRAQVDGEEFTKQPSIIEQKAYRDTWGRGIDSYLQMMYERLTCMRELLAESGGIYVHLDEVIAPYVRLVMDEVFGRERFVNAITWKRSHAHSDEKQGTHHYGRVTDVILFYAQSQAATWNPQYVGYDPSYVDRDYRRVDTEGRRYRIDNLQGPGGAAKGNPSYEVMGVTRYWRYSKERMEELIVQGRVIQTRPGAVPQYKRYLDEMPGVPIQNLWDDIPVINNRSAEILGYDTQKPEALLERIVKASSNEGDLVLDCFCGSGTTAAVAEKLGRRWIACDLGRFAIHTTRKRLLAIDNVKPFVVQNLGRYERQVWQAAEFGERAEATQAAYRRFVLDLYHAREVSGYTWLHGLKAGRMVHVGAVDSPVSPGDITQIAIEFRRAIGSGADAPSTNAVDVLGWDFAFELNEVARQHARDANLPLRFLRIPRDVMDKRAVEQGDVHFFELAALGVDVACQGRSVTLLLTDFMIPPDDVPEDVRQAVTSWEQWIDYWAVDWQNKDDTFHNQWQDYRTRKKRTLQRTITHEYDEPGAYTVVVKVIDILGNDTTKTLTVQVASEAASGRQKTTVASSSPSLLGEGP